MRMSGPLLSFRQVSFSHEPSAGLDEHFEQRVIQVLTDLHPAMIVVSHDMDFLGKVTEKTVCLRDHTLQTLL